MERQIIEIVRDGETKSALHLGPDEFGVPRHLLQGEKMEGIISDGSELRPWFWDGFCTIDEERYVYFDKCNIESIDTIATTHRKDALDLVRKIAFGLSNASEKFLDLTSGIFPLYRIYIYEGKDILLLPPDLADIVSIMIDEETKENESTALIRSVAEPTFRLITEMAELLYYAASGTLPFAKREIRSAGYKEIPLSSYVVLNEKTDGLISFIFHAKNREMRDITGNRNGGAALKWFYEKSLNLEWNLENRSEEERARAVAAAENDEKINEYLAKAKKTAKRNDFWRIKGTVITVCAIIGVFVIAFLYDYITNLLEPPYTQDMGQEEIIYAVYDAQSRVNPEDLDASVKGTNLPQSMEVTNLFVTSRTRMAYEATNPAIDANVWIEQGRQAIPDTSYIYGVIVESIEEIGENEYVAVGIWYVPFPYEEEDTVTLNEADKIVAYRYRVTQTFSFKWNNRGWWNIVDSEITGYEKLEPEIVDTYSIGSNSLLM